MLKLFVILAGFGLSASPTLAQTAPAQAAPAPAAKPKTVTKVVCKRVAGSEGTGSRLSSSAKVCRKVQVPVESESGTEAQKDSAGNRGR
ncbi:MAG TPA: hypothetical protein VFI88_02590 [Sphingomicrobium sp.]|jgi:hypothetical protein|nr:hypothetical protein [Sphingomicrobium sp.]